MRVYYVGSGLQGCYTVRCLLPLMANGWDGDQTSLNKETKTPENKAEAAKHADVVVFHRPDDPMKLEMARLLKQYGKKVVFDNDDTFKDYGGFKFNDFMDANRAIKGLEKINTVVDKFIREADLVTCSTKFLKDEYEKLNPNVVVLPNCVDPFYFDEPLKNENGKVRIGIIGSIAITSDLDVCKPIIEHFMDRDDVEIVLFSLPPEGEDKLTKELYADEYEFLNKMREAKNVVWQPFVYHHEYFNTLNELRLDINIIPRADNYFNRCKSNLKFLEASMYEVPTIAQGFEDGNSPYQDPEDAKHMVIVTNNEDWIPEIERLVKDKEAREMLGKKAKEYVIDRYDIEKNAHKWEEAYQLMFKKK